MALRILSVLALICLATAAPIMPIVNENVVAQPEVADVEVKESRSDTVHAANDMIRASHYNALSDKLVSVSMNVIEATATKETAEHTFAEAQAVQSSAIGTLSGAQQKADAARKALADAEKAATDAASSHDLTSADVSSKKEYLAAMEAALNTVKGQKAAADADAATASSKAESKASASTAAAAALAAATSASAAAKAAAEAVEHKLEETSSKLGAELAAAEESARAAGVKQQESAAAAAAAASEASAAADARAAADKAAATLAEELAKAQAAYDDAVAALAAAESAEAAAKAARAQADSALAAAKADHEASARTVDQLAAAADAASNKVRETQTRVATAIASVKGASEALAAANLDFAVQKAKLCTQGSDTWHSGFCEGCDGVVGSGKVKDLCGVCGGDDSSCKDCAGIPNGKSSVRDWCDWTGCTSGGCSNNDGKTGRSGYNGAGWEEKEKYWCGSKFSGWYNNELCCRSECY